MTMFVYFLLPGARSGQLLGLLFHPRAQLLSTESPADMCTGCAAVHVDAMHATAVMHSALFAGAALRAMHDTIGTVRPDRSPPPHPPPNGACPLRDQEHPA